MRRRTALPLGVLFLLTLTAADCEDPQVVPVPTSIELISGDGQQAEVGAQLPQPLVVRVLDQNDDPMSAIDVTWAASAGTIVGSGATDENGETSATWTLGTEVGTLDATASLNANTSVSFTATAVAGALAAITLTPDSLAFDALGDTATIDASGEDAHGNEVGFTATWMSRDTAVATVDGAGAVVSVGNGSTWVVASSNGVSDSIRAVVEQTAASVDLSPAADSVVVGQTTTYTATARDANAFAVEGAAFVWATEDTSIATVDSSGVVTGAAEGATRVFATHGSLTDTADVVVVSGAGLDADLVGEWVAVRVDYTNPNDSTQTVSVDDGDDLLLLTFRADSTFAYYEVSGDQTDQSAGTWLVSGDTLIVYVSHEDTTFHFPYTKTGSDEFAFTIDNDEYDFNDDGVDERAIATIHAAPVTDLPELIGTWESQSVVAVNINDSTQSADLSAEVSVTATFRTDGSHSVVIEETDSTEVEVGWYATGGGSLWLVQPQESVERFALAVSGDTATLSFKDTFDFDNDGVDEDAAFTIRFVPGTGSGAGQIDPDLVGDWVGISYVLENQNDTSQEVDRVVDEGLLLEAFLYNDGTFATRDRESTGETTWEDVGTWYTRNDTVVWFSTAEQDSILFPYTKVDSTTFVFETVDQEGYDFDGDGVDEPTNETGVMARRVDAALVGTWVAEAQVIVNAADTTQWVDAIAEGGSLTATFYADGSVAVDQVEPDLGDQFDLDGQVYSFYASEYAAALPFLWIVENDGIEQLGFLLDGDVATVQSEYEANVDGQVQTVIETVSLRRQ